MAGWTKGVIKYFFPAPARNDRDRPRRYWAGAGRVCHINTSVIYRASPIHDQTKYRLTSPSLRCLTRFDCPSGNHSVPFVAWISTGDTHLSVDVTVAIFVFVTVSPTPPRDGPHPRRHPSRSLPTNAGQTLLVVREEDQAKSATTSRSSRSLRTKDLAFPDR